MNGTAAALGFSRPSYQYREPFGCTSGVVLQSADPARNVLAVKCLLKQAGLTMVDVSARTKKRFGEKTPYFVPQTFLYKQKNGVTPHICQVAALSEVTGFHFSHWLTLCGFSFELILSLQIKLPNERTILLTPLLDQSSIMSLQACSDRTTHAHGEAHARYLYAKIGNRDAVTEPDVHPGSIIRVDRHVGRQLLRANDNRLWLVEHPAGITCCRVKAMGNSQVILLPNRPPLSPWPLRLTTQARILGLVDRELRGTEIENIRDIHRTLDQSPFSKASSYRQDIGFSRLLRTSRLRVGLTFREAHRLTLLIAGLLENHHFGIAAGLLSDYEAMNKVPRHIAKIISLSAVYGIDPRELIASAGVQVDDSARRPIFTSHGLRQERA